MKKIVFIILGLMPYMSFSQIESMYSLYRLNSQLVDPAQENKYGVHDFNLINRQQWVGEDGAPVTMGFSYHGGVKDKMGLGLVLLNDHAGPVSNTVMAGDFNYTVALSDQYKLTGGVRAGMANLTLDGTDLRLIDPADPIFGTKMSTGYHFNTGWGIRLTSKQGTFLAISQPRVLAYDFGVSSGGFKDVPFVYFQAGTRYRFNEKIALLPSTLFRVQSGSPLSWDLNVLVNLLNKFDIGVSYRDKDSIGLQLGVKANEKMYIGYIYESPMANNRYLKGGTHEICLRFTLVK